MRDAPPAILLTLAPRRGCSAAARPRRARARSRRSSRACASNQLTGYGIVVGLAGTGDDNLEYLTQAMKGASGRLGLQLPPGVSPGLKNAAAVMITADLPAFAKPGQRIDITVSTIGKAKSLRGGALIMTPLYGADGQIYAMAQGNLAVGGLGVSAQGRLAAHRQRPHRGPHRRGRQRRARGRHRVRQRRRRCAATCSTPISSPPQRVRDAINRRCPGHRHDRGRRDHRAAPAAGRRHAAPRLMAAIEMIERHAGRNRRAGDRQQPHRHGRDQQRGAPVARRDQPRQAGRADRREARASASPRRFSAGQTAVAAGQRRSTPRRRAATSRCSSPGASPGQDRRCAQQAGRQPVATSSRSSKR